MDKTTRMDRPTGADDGARVIARPSKDRVNLGLAAVAGALAALVLLTVSGALGGTSFTGAAPERSAPAHRSAPPTPTQPPADGDGD